MDAVIGAGFPYELAGLAYYVFFMLMSRKSNAGVYSLRSRILVVLAAIVMVGCVPFHYADAPLGVASMFAIAILASLSALVDTARRGRR